jgi:hypothetical protein
MVQFLDEVPTPVWLLLSGLCGGLASFLYGLKRGNFKNNRYCRKISLEMVGGTVTGFFLTLPTKAWGAEYRLLIAFACGLAWSAVLQMCRLKITGIAEAVLGVPKQADS